MWSAAEIARATRENLSDSEFKSKKLRTQDVYNLQLKQKTKRVVRVLGRRYPLTETFYKYLDIGVRIGGYCNVELAIGDNRGNEIQFSMATWKDLVRKRHDILQNFACSSETLSDPIRVNDILIEFRQLHDAKLVKLSNSTASLLMSEKTMRNLFAFEYCIDHMFSWLSENLYLIEFKCNTFLQIIQRAETKDFAKVITENANFEQNSLIDCELLALGLDILVCNAGIQQQK